MILYWYNRHGSLGIKTSYLPIHVHDQFCSLKKSKGWGGGGGGERKRILSSQKEGEVRCV